ncbi:uncharacterized protein LOC116927028 isoform X2 [Daphnia magna]|uniref:uncharacterized protein LOC116927028 isoform X2 n=1 Tax=Daphnia magna TaxID=35525 RepID=UPI001E1BC205|nr:uncharacterized protein LOC116927028 isoform X2 [Daphnia magna]
MEGEERSHGSLNAMPATSSRRYESSEDIFPEILSWIQDANTDQKLAENAVSHISSKLERALNPLETTGVESQYVKAVLTTWAEASLKSAFNYLEDERTDLCKEMPNILDELDSVNSVEDIDAKLNKETSQLWTWFDGGRLYIQLILEQENLFKNTPRFAILLNHYFNNVKRCFINKAFARCKDDIINDGLNGSSLKEFISALTDFLTNANEDKDLQDVVKNHMRESNVTTRSRKTDGQVIKDGLKGLLTEENISDEFDEMFKDFLQDESNIATGSQETDGQKCNGMKEWVKKLIEIVRNALPSSDSKESLIPEWLLGFESASSEIKEWTTKLELLIRETCAKLMLPETVIEVKQQYGRQVMFISGVAVFVSKELEKMKSKKRDVGEIQIVGQTSVHIDCDLENEIWHGFNVGIVTDKLVVWADDKGENRIWDVSGRCPRFKSRRDWQDAGESGGNVHIKCNEIIGADRWTIASNGGDGVSALKWSEKEFKRVFSPILPPDTDMKKDRGDEQQVSGRSEINDLYTKLETNMRKEFGSEVSIDFSTRSTRLNDGSKITYSLYKNKKKKRHTLILCKGAGVGQGGYGGDIILELSNKERGVPPTGMEMYQALDSTGVVYKATGSDGKMEQANGDVGFIHNEEKTSKGSYVGFEIGQSLRIQRHKKEEFKKDEVASYVRFDAGDFLGDRFYATIVDVPDAVQQEEQDFFSPMVAKKKNAVIRQSLVVQLTNINERKQILESLRKTLMSDLLEENQSQNVDQLMEEIRNNAIQFGEQVDQQLNQEKVAHTKPAPVVRSRAAHETKGEGPINLQLEEDEEKGRSNLKHYDKLERHGEEVKRLFNRIEDKRKSALKANTKEWTAERKLRNFEPINVASLAEYFYDFECVLQHLRNDNTFQLRNYQIEAILQLIIATREESERRLAEISTGAGKSLIVAASAIALARGRGFDVHVITSNDLLAIRDSNLSVAEGGLKDLYEYFNVQVANNCSQSEDDRKLSYTARVVYGQLANFQRDFLLDNLYGRNIHGSPHMKAKVVIIDEVDCMLLDQGNNTLYLSHGIPGMESLESLYVFIWDEICNSPINKTIPDYRKQVKKSIKSNVLFDLYGVITKDDLKCFVHVPPNDSEKDALWDHLMKKKVIDRNGRLLIDDANQMTEEKINYTPKNAAKETNLNAKLVFYLRKVANRLRQIRIPAHLLDFVDRHLDTWLESAFQALDLRPDEDYVIDQDRTDTSPDLNPQVIIIDPDTGTDQTLSQWDEALHQFVQLKEGCKLTLQTLKAVFISNATYINQYPYIYGLSGTLGSEQEKHFLQDTFKSTFYYNHTHIPRLFEQKLAKVLSTENEWLDAIIMETKTIMKEGRSIIIFCMSIKNVNLVHQRLINSFPDLVKKNRLHRYTRDYVKFAFERTELDIKHVIVATNLAGRGTDIKISQKLRDNGGLHVCLSYFPETKRIEEQAMGRAARNGAPGSGILIACKPSSSERLAPDEREPIEIMKNEREIREKQRIARMKEDFKFMKDQMELIDPFSKYYTNLKEQRRKKNDGDQIVSAICGSVLDQWALWLDEMNDSPLDVKKYSYSEKFIPKLKAVEQDNLDISQIEWMTPARLVVVARHLATRHKKPDLPKAVEILEELIQSKDRHFYPAAFYYRAFIHLKENYETNKNEFVKTLRTCENVLSDHINMQISFFSTVQTTKRKIDQPLSFCVVDGYTQQKENVINVLQYFVGSVRSLLGTDCSIEDFEAAGQLPKEMKGFFEKNLNNFEKWIQREIHENFKVFQEKDVKNKDPKNLTIPPEKVEEYFKLLLEGESKCIGHQLNDASTIPSWNSFFERNAKSNRELAIERISNVYGVCAFTLEKSLDQAAETALSKEAIEEAIEKEMKEKFEKDNLIPCTRESFWAKLVETGALYNNQNFVAVDEGNVDTFNLNRNEAKTFHFEDKDYVLYIPIDVNSKNGGEKKTFFTQKYVEDTLYGNRMNNTSRDQLQFNKIAKVDVVKLKSVDLKLFGQLTDDDLRKADISPAERQGIMDELKKQDFIDVDGNLSSNYNGQMFEYPNCPAYEETVMRLVGSKLRVEIVRRQWLNRQDNSIPLEVINLLPLTPCRDMLDDLIDAYVISGGVRVKEMNERVLERKVNEITKKEHERECILDFLKSRQAIYDATWLASQEAALDFIDGDIRKVKANTFESELGLFRSIGFDHVIYMKDRQMSRKQMVLSSLFTPLIVIGGIASISAGAVLTIFSKILPLRDAKDLLLMGGLSDIIFVITSALSNDPIRFPDYARQRIRGALGKSNLVDQVKTLWKLSRPGKLAGNNFRPAARLQMDSFHQRRVREKNHEADQREIVNALRQLKKLSTNPSDEDGNSVQ